MCRSNITVMKDKSSVRHWNSARELVGNVPPTPDDVSTTLAGEPLDSAEKVREFLSSLDRVRSA